MEAGSDFTAKIEPCERIAERIISDKEALNESLIEEKIDAGKLNIMKSLGFKGQTSISVFPNPSWDFTTIEFFLANNDIVTVEIYDAKGVLITTLMTDKQHDEGKYRLVFDISDFPSGQYNCILKTSSTLKNCRIIKI